MLTFIYIKRFKFHNLELVNQLKEIRTVSQLCYLINNLKSFDYYKQIEQIDTDSFNHLVRLLFKNKIIHKNHGYYKPMKIYDKIYKVFQKGIAIESHEFKQLCITTYEEFEQDFNSLVEQFKANGKPKIKHNPKRSVSNLPLSPSQYDPALHEDYVYSDANWSPKDASL